MPCFRLAGPLQRKCQNRFATLKSKAHNRANCSSGPCRCREKGLDTLSRKDGREDSAFRNDQGAQESLFQPRMSWKLDMHIFASGCARDFMKTLRKLPR